jgi:hypothetical protein
MPLFVFCHSYPNAAQDGGKLCWLLCLGGEYVRHPLELLIVLWNGYTSFGYREQNSRSYYLIVEA